MYTSHPVAELKPGTMMEILRGRGITEVAVVICSEPIMLRKATAWETYQYWFRSRRPVMGELAAGADAAEAIDKAKKDYVR